MIQSASIHRLSFEIAAPHPVASIMTRLGSRIGKNDLRLSNEELRGDRVNEGPNRTGYVKIRRVIPVLGYDLETLHSLHDSSVRWQRPLSCWVSTVSTFYPQGQQPPPDEDDDARIALLANDLWKDSAHTEPSRSGSDLA